MTSPSNTVTLLVDTNLFFECKALDQLPWDDLGFDTVIVLVAKPVLDEIDRHKKGSGRTRKRALEIYTRIRRMLKNGAHEDVIQEANPRVVFKLDQNTKFDEQLETQLNKNKADDQLVGILSTLASANPQMEFKLFTHDTGPAQTASSLDLPFELIDDVWLRPERESDEKKKIGALESDIKNLQSQEPQISIGLENETPVGETVSVIRTVAEPLSSEQIDKLIEKLKTYFPIEKDFTRKPIGLGDALAKKIGATVEYVPASKEGVSNYCENEYPDWLQSCRAMLAECHENLAEPIGRIPLTFVMENVGSRPATNVRINFGADGDIRFYRFSDDKENDNEAEIAPTSKKSLILSQPPTAPQPTRAVKKMKSATNIDIAKMLPKNTISDLSKIGGTHTGLIKELSRIGTLDDTLRRALGSRMDTPFMTPTMISPNFKHLTRPRHDQEGFYYSDWPSDLPVNKGALTCDLWRHQSATQNFELEVAFDPDGRRSGSIACEVHAENISKPILLRIKVKVETQVASTYEYAEKAIKKLRMMANITS